MKFLGFKEQVVGYLMLYIALGFVPVAFSGRIVTPFLLTPLSEVELYNYVGNLTTKLRPLLLLYSVYLSICYMTTVTGTNEVNKWLHSISRDVMRCTMAVMLYQGKEVLDYVMFENVVPRCLDYFWFLMGWEVAPIFILFVWAFRPFASDEE